MRYVFTISYTVNHNISMGYRTYLVRKSSMYMWVVTRSSACDREWSSSARLVMASGSHRSRSRNVSAADVARTLTYEEDQADSHRPGSGAFYGHSRQRDASRYY